MLASKDFADGHYTSTPHHGIRAFGRVYCAWAYGQTVSNTREVDDKHSYSSAVVQGASVPYGWRVSAIQSLDRRVCRTRARYPDLNSFIRERWEGRYIQYWDANDMIALLTTWQRGDISIVRDGGDYEKALKSIKAKGLIMPSKTDLYFPVRCDMLRCIHVNDLNPFSRKTVKWRSPILEMPHCMSYPVFGATLREEGRIPTMSSSFQTRFMHS